MAVRIIGIILVIVGAIGVYLAKQLIAFFTKREATDVETATLKMCSLLVIIAGAGSIFLS